VILQVNATELNIAPSATNLQSGAWNAHTLICFVDNSVGIDGSFGYLLGICVHSRSTWLLADKTDLQFPAPDSTIQEMQIINKQSG